MKRISIIMSAILFVCMSVFLTGCNEKALAVPANFYLDDEENLNWSPVENARTYDVEITAVADETISVRSTRRTVIGLMTLQEGDYNIRVRAVGGGNVLASPWSETVAFKKLPEAGYTYKALDDGTAWTLSSARASVGDVVIDGEYRGKPVREIADGAFRNNEQVTSVTFTGDTIRKFGNRVFYNCLALVSVTLPQSVESFGTAVFQGCRSLTKADLPESLDAIPDFTYAYCESLGSASISENVKSIGESAFYSCTALKEIDLPDSVETIGQYAFSRNEALNSFTFGAGIKSVGEYAFLLDECLTSVEFSPAYENLDIGRGAFSACTALTGFAFPEGTSAIPALCFDGASELGEVIVPDSVTAVGQLAFQNTQLLTAQTGFAYADHWLIQVPAEIKSGLTALSPEDFGDDEIVGIADAVFRTQGEIGCPDLAEVRLPRSLRFIGEYAFYGCSSLWKVTTETESLLEAVGANAFRSCSFLSNIQFDCELKSIGDYAFRDCVALNNNQINPERLIPTTVTHIGQGAYRGTALFDIVDSYGIIYAANWAVGYDKDRSATSAILKEDTIGIADYAFANHKTLQSMEGVNRVRYLGKGAFMNCENLLEVTLSRNLTEIAPFTFFQCLSLTSVGRTLPQRLRSIGDYAFFQCDSLRRIDLVGTSVEEIGLCAYFSCGAETVDLNEGLETIGAYAFSYDFMKQIELPSSVKTVGANAFTYCQVLETVQLNEGLVSIDKYAFRGCGSLMGIAIPNTVVSLGEGAFLQCERMEKLVLGSALERIGNFAFGLCLNLKSVVFSANIRVIGDYAFLYCAGLDYIMLPASLEYVGSYAFYGCIGATFYTSLSQAPEGWNGRWNSSFRPVIWEAVFADEGYVRSIQTPGGITVRGGISAPERTGYRFLGWSRTEGGEVEYGAREISSLKAGITLYAVWQEGADEPEIPDESEITDEQ